MAKAKQTPKKLKTESSVEEMVTQSEISEVTKTFEAFHRENLRLAANAFESELENLDQINRTKAIKEIAELFEVTPQELWYYVEFGEEESQQRLAPARVRAEEELPLCGPDIFKGCNASTPPVSNKSGGSSE